MGKKIVLAVLGILVVFVLFIGISIAAGYNQLVDMDENINSKYSQIEVRLQERHDKIGQLVAAVNGLQEYALDVYNLITSARAQYAAAESSGNMNELIEADAAEAAALQSLLVVVEDNPNINVTAAYVTLMDEISSMESALAVARRDFNNAVQEYNASVRKFPRILYAKALGFDAPLDYWKMDDGASEVPEVTFD